MENLSDYRVISVFFTEAMPRGGGRTICGRERRRTLPQLIRQPVDLGQSLSSSPAVPYPVLVVRLES